MTNLEKRLPKSIENLFEPSGGSFLDALRDVDKIPAEEVTEVITAVLDRVREILLSGHFKDLRGAENLLSELNVEISLDGEYIERINHFLPRLSEVALINICRVATQSPNSTENKIATGRKILYALGFSEDESNDDDVDFIIKNREVLLKLKEISIESVQGYLSLLKLVNGF